MKITEQNYGKHQKLFSLLTNWIKSTPHVFNSTSFVVKNKLIKFHNLNKALKDFDREQQYKMDAINPVKRNIGNYHTEL